MPRKSNNTLLWVVLGVVALVIIVPCVGIAGAGLWAWNMVKPMAGCAMSYDYVEKAIQAYSAANDGKLPPAATWQDDVRSYYLSAQQSGEQMPFDTFKADGEWSCSTGSTKTGISYNSNVGGKNRKDLSGSEILVFEVPMVGKNQNSPYKKLPMKSSPKIFGENRPWLTITVDGNSSASHSKWSD